MNHAEEAARLAAAVEESNPALAGVIHALLAIAGGGGGDSGWHKLDDFEDLPDQLDQDYVLEYADGSQVKWRLSADNASSVQQFVWPGDPTVWKDCNDIVDECTRWRYA